MKSRILTLGAAAVLAVASVATVRAEMASDVEAARARARAGGPISEEDHYLLKKYGALSGTHGFSPGGVYDLRRDYKRRYDGRKSLR